MPLRGATLAPAVSISGSVQIGRPPQIAQPGAAECQAPRGELDTDVGALPVECPVADRDRFGNEVHTVIEQEPGASGKIVAQGWVRKIGGRAEAKPNSGDKEVRATPLSAQQLAGNVRLVRNADGSRPAWWDLLIGEATLFPNGRNDDIIDGASSAYNYINAKLRRSKARARTAADRSI